MKTILITGCNRGIGFEFVRQFSLMDINIIATYRNKSSSEELLSLVEKSSKIELLEATHKDSAIAKFLSKNKAGFHHIAFDVDNVIEEIHRLEKKGFQLIHKVPKTGADQKSIAFLHPKSTNGILVELCQDI